MDTFFLGVKYFFITLFADIIKWPVWWYSRGVVFVFNALKNSFLIYSAQLSVGVWVKNLFVPMFGQRDWQSRFISFFMRLVQIIGRSFVLMIWGMVQFLLFVAYLIIPAVAVFFVVEHLIGGIIF